MLGAGAASAVLWELETSQLQARLLAGLGQELKYEVKSGPSADIRFPKGGPFDERRGYNHISEFVERLKPAGYQVERQAAPSPKLAQVMALGLQAPYREKPQAGLLVLDRAGGTMFAARFPHQVYPSFAAIPPVVARVLSFIEDRNVLDAETATFNPAIDWRRFAKALAENAMAAVDDERRGPGGSTLATQLEKMRHSPDGITTGAGEKLRQIASASLRAYHRGEDTRAAREEIVVAYLNSLPLGAAPGEGEVIGLAQGLAAWYGADFEAVNAALMSGPSAKAPAAGPALVAKGPSSGPGGVDFEAVNAALAPKSPSPLEGEVREGGWPLSSGQESLLRADARDPPPDLPLKGGGDEVREISGEPLRDAAPNGTARNGAALVRASAPANGHPPCDCPAATPAAGLALKQVLSLVIAQRHPGRFLGGDRRGLAELTDSYLRLLAEAGIITPALRDQALAARLLFSPTVEDGPEPEFLARKGANAIRGRIAALLGLDSFYDLDRLDLTVESEIDAPTQGKVTAALVELREPARVAELGLRGFRLLDRGDPAKVTYSFSLYERGEGANWLRVQTDNVDQPFSVVDGAKIDLGSTAKLRTLVTYLDIVAALHAKYAGRPAAELRAVRTAPADALTRWALDRLLADPDATLRDFLLAAMQRPYSASPAERFFTGGGVHEFHNFDAKDDHRVMPVAEAFRHSVNLVFVRLMRDIVGYYQFRLPGSPAAVLAADAPERLDYLRKFADREGRVYLGQFFRKYHGLRGHELIDNLVDGMRLTPARLAAAIRYLQPAGGAAALAAAFETYLPDLDMEPETVAALAEAYAPERYDLVDRAYVMGVHPLELWLAGWLGANPDASWSETVAASADERVEVYRWLYRSSRKRAQDVRIRTILELEAFLELHQAWQKLGYPFDRVVPSLATSIGASADRPSALADLMGILLNDGVRLPTLRMRRLHFAAGTPYETVLAPAQPAAERVLPAEVARIVREALADVVAHGTARRVHKAFATPDGATLAVGGKTGTGDHREKVYARGSRLIGERVKGRAATFVFYVGERHYGIVTAYVAGPDAADYRFTSGLPVQILAHLAPTLRDIIERDADPLRDKRLIAKPAPPLQPEPAAARR